MNLAEEANLSKFLRIVQTGLLMHVTSHGTQYVRVSSSQALEPGALQPLYNAYVDAENIILPLGDVGKHAIQFIKWTTCGTEYAWIKEQLGTRGERTY